MAHPHGVFWWHSFNGPVVFSVAEAIALWKNNNKYVKGKFYDKYVVVSVSEEN